MFAGKKSAQIREILINESAWEEMTCLFALSLTKAVSLDPQDIQAFRELDKLGVKLDLRVVASDPSVNILDKINETAFCE